MIKAIGEKGGKPLYVFGLTRGNCERLLKGQPIMIDLDVMCGVNARDCPRLAEPGPLRGSVLILGGETEQAMLGELSQNVPLPTPMP